MKMGADDAAWHVYEPRCGWDDALSAREFKLAAIFAQVFKDGFAAGRRAALPAPDKEPKNGD